MHFTYDSNIDKENLCQGDILAKTEDLVRVISEVHPHYARPEYTHYQIISQTCDLVRRGSSKKCATRYITLAAVRSLSTVIQRAIEEAAGKGIIQIGDTQFCSDRHKDKVKSVVTSLLNNNDNSHFYLEKCVENGIDQHSCTFLRLSIAIKSELHYDTCLNAKLLQLDQVFQSKLGWKIGNLYSRVGTPDYVPAVLNQQEFNELVNNLVDSEVGWIESNIFQLFKQARVDSPDLNNPTEYIQLATQLLKDKTEKLADTLVDRLSKKVGLTHEQKSDLKQAFLSDTKILGMLQRELK